MKCLGLASERMPTGDQANPGKHKRCSLAGCLLTFKNPYCPKNPLSIVGGSSSYQILSLFIGHLENIYGLWWSPGSLTIDDSGFQKLRLQSFQIREFVGDSLNHVARRFS